MALEFLSPIHKATRQIAVHLSARTQALGMGGSEAHILTYLKVYGPAPVGRLRSVFGYSGSTLTGILDRMEKAGHIHRELRPDDRRSFSVAVTPEGVSAAAGVQKHVDALEAQIRRHVSKQDRQGFRRVMEAIGVVTQVELTSKETA